MHPMKLPARCRERAAKELLYIVRKNHPNRKRIEAFGIVQTIGGLGRQTLRNEKRGSVHGWIARKEVKGRSELEIRGRFARKRILLLQLGEEQGVLVKQGRWAFEIFKVD